MRDGKIFILDASYWNDDTTNTVLPDFTVAKAKGVDGIINKIGQGFGSDGTMWPDRMFQTFFTLQGKAGILRGTYYFLDHDQRKYKAGQPEAWGAKQARAVYAYITKYGCKGEIPHALDTEINAAWGTLTDARIISDLIPMSKAYLDTIADLFKFNDLLYYCNRHFEKMSASLTRRLLWLSHLEGEAYKYPNNYWPLKHFTEASLALEQWTSSLNGKDYGFDSGSLDGNRWRLSTAAFYDLMKRWNPDSPLLKEPTPEDETPTTPTDPGPIVVEPTTGKNRWIRIAKVIPAGLTIRKTPTVNAWNLTGLYLKENDTVDVLEEITDAAGNKWARIGIQQFCAIRYNGKDLLNFSW